jgi:hypothetical protein
MSFYEIIGFLLFIAGSLIYLFLIRPTLKEEDRKGYSVGKLGYNFVGFYYFYDLSSYKRKCIKENKSIFVWWLSIIIIISLIIWILVGLAFLLTLILSGELAQWLQRN